jgi:uncharacterized membrane protein
VDSTLARLHLAALATYFASTLYVILVVRPSAAAIQDPSAQRRFLAREFRLQNPISIGALGVLLMTGAFQLTEVKARLGPSFFATLGRGLMIKLTLAFVLINVATYVAFGLAHRLVRAHQGNLPVNASQQASMLRRLAVASWLALLLVLATTWVSVELGPALRAGVANRPPSLP